MNPNPEGRALRNILNMARWNKDKMVWEAFLSRDQMEHCRRIAGLNDVREDCRAVAKMMDDSPVPADAKLIDPDGSAMAHLREAFAKKPLTRKDLDDVAKAMPMIGESGRPD